MPPRTRVRRNQRDRHQRQHPDGRERRARGEQRSEQRAERDHRQAGREQVADELVEAAQRDIDDRWHLYEQMVEVERTARFGILEEED